MRKLVNKIPTPITGLMLALAATGNLVAAYGYVYRAIFGFSAAIVLILLVIKIVINTKVIKEELNNPVIASVVPTFSMGIMVLSTYIESVMPTFAFGIWILGIFIHSGLMIYFTNKFILSFNIKKVFPSYFIVYVGIVVGSVTAPVFKALILGQIIFWFGFTAYLVLLPIVIYRVFLIKSIPEPAVPTFTIFAAPASLCLAGYINSFPQKNMVIVWMLVLVSLTMLLGVLVYMPKMLKVKFYPSYSAFTFPCVISAIAIKSTNSFFINLNREVSVLKYVVRFEEIIAVIIVIYVLIRYINFIFINPPIKEKANIMNNTTL